MRQIRVKSQNKVTCADLIGRVAKIQAVMDEFKQRGGMLTVLDEAEAPESKRRALVNQLERIRERAVAYLVEIGDDRRARRQSVPLCSLPPAQERVILATLPGKREDGKDWFK